jgi:tetratricopeptide (TPR) repeat protein
VSHPFLADVNPMPTLQDAYNLHQAGRLDEAEFGYRAWLAERPADADALHLLGMLRHQRGDSAEALRLVSRAHDLQPDNGQLELALATLLRHAGDPAAARLAYARALALDPNLGGAHIGLGQLALDSGDTATAEEHFRTALRAGEDGHALAGLGAIMLARGRSEAALGYLTRAAELVPDYSMIQFMLGQAFSQRGLLTFAETALGNALRLQPDLHAAHAWLAEVLLKDNRPHEALVHYQALVPVAGYAVVAQIGFADIARMEQRDEQAIAYYRAALALEPKLAVPTRMLAWMLATLGRNDEAIAAYDAYLAHAPEDVEMRILRDDVHKLHTGDSA